MSVKYNGNEDTIYGKVSLHVFGTYHPSGYIPMCSRHDYRLRCPHDHLIELLLEHLMYSLTFFLVGETGGGAYSREDTRGNIVTKDPPCRFVLTTSL